MMWIAMLAAFLCVVGFSSCVENKGLDYDFMDCVTVTDDGLGRVCLVCDETGLRLYPTNSSVLNALRMTDGSYYKRAYVGVKLMEEYTQAKKEYNISELYVSYPIPYMGFNMKKDTLNGDYGFGGLNRSWARTGFVNVEFNVNVENDNTSTFYNDLHMYVTGAENDTLFTKLRYVKPVENGRNYTVFVSFELPRFCPEYNQLNPKGDTIIIKVEAEGRFKDDLQISTPYSYRELMGNY